ncbi:MAG: glycosyltransferase [Bacteroidetes bacterium]|nr:glycosyltransferase [Bacteroidota bacterium]
MKLVINGRFLTQPASGVQNFAAGIVTALEKKGIAFELIAPPSQHTHFHNNVKVLGPKNGFLWEQFFLPRYIKKQKNTLLLNLCNAAPLSLNNQIITIHDLAFEQKKNWFKPAFKKWYQFMIPRICRNSKMIFTVSGFSKKEIIRHYHIPENKISIIPNGLPELKTANGNMIRGNYFLMTGCGNPRKNAAAIIRYINLIEQKGCKLVILKSQKDVFANVELPKHRAITYLNDVKNIDYLFLLKNAKALIYPSLYEGFGIPILESLCLGTPVIASDLEVFRESFGDLPVYFQPENAGSFEKAMEMIEKKEIPEAAREQLKNNFNFDHAASQVLKHLETLQ